MVFGGRAHPELAAKIAAKLGIGLGPVTLKTFSNGEVYCRYDESIRGADVFIVQPRLRQPGDRHQRQRRADGAHAHDRRGRRRLRAPRHRGDARGTATAARTRSRWAASRSPPAPSRGCSRRVGADRVLTMDLHAGQVQGFFQIPVDHMTALRMLTDYFRDLNLPDLVVVAPDVGRAKLNQKFAEKVGGDLAILTKERPAHQVAEIGYVIGDVKDKTAVLLDDMIDTAGTLKAAAQTVLESGARSVYAAATHPVLSRPRVREPRRGRASRRSSSPTRSRCAPARPTTSASSAARPADRLDPPDLHRRLGERGLRRREPALLDRCRWPASSSSGRRRTRSRGRSTPSAWVLDEGAGTPAITAAHAGDELPAGELARRGARRRRRRPRRRSPVAPLTPRYSRARPRAGARRAGRRRGRGRAALTAPARLYAEAVRTAGLAGRGDRARRLAGPAVARPARRARRCCTRSPACRC